MDSGHVWLRPRGAGLSNDLSAFWHELNAVVRAGGWRVFEMGPVMGHPMPLLGRAASRPDAPNLLIAAGFHGEEPAGPWGLLRFLGSAQMRTTLELVNLAVLPLVNATGFAAGRRFNDRGENPNRGYSPGPDARALSVEGKVLKRHWAVLRRLGAHGVLACHEDRSVTRSYVYTYEPGRRPGPFSRSLAHALSRYSALHPNGTLNGCPVRDGVIFNRHDGSFESEMARQGVPATACLETPGMSPLAVRIQAQAHAIETFVLQRAKATRQ